MVGLERGWYPDPASGYHLRWWSGLQWTQETRPRPPAPAPLAARTGHVADVWLPPQLIEFGYLPGVCVRHGLPAVRMQQAPAYSRTPGWVIPLALVSLLLSLLIALAVRATVWGPWPVCALCERQRQRYRQALWGCLAAGALTIVAAIVLSLPALLLLEIPLFLAAIVFRGLGDWYRVTSAVVERDRSFVRVKSPSGAFSAALAGVWSPAPPMTFAPQRRW